MLPQDPESHASAGLAPVSPPAFAPTDVRRPASSSRRKKRHHQHRHRSYLRAKILLVLIWIVSRVLDVAALYFLTAAHQKIALAPLIAGTIWSTTLIIVIWKRQVWGRYIFAAYLVLLTVGAGFLATYLVDPTRALVAPDYRVISFLAADVFCYAAMAWLILTSKDIAYLTEPSAGMDMNRLKQN